MKIAPGIRMLAPAGAVLLSFGTLLNILACARIEAEISSEPEFSETDADSSLHDDVSEALAETEEPAHKYEEIPLRKLRVSGLSPLVETTLDYVDAFYSEWEECRYIFLPATADRKHLIISYETEDSARGLAVSLGDTVIHSGAETDLLSSADSFTLKIGEREYGELRVMQSDLGCIYLSTQHGGLDFIDAAKSRKDEGTALMLGADGSIVYNGELDSITSHGNSSWDYSPRKHPYNIKLESKADLYGMGKAKKWVLLSNFLDFSQLRNKIAFETAREAGIEYVPDYTFVDLFADGSYRGTYQLTERIDIQKNRVNITDLEEKTEDLNEKDLGEYDHIAEGAKVDEYLENSCKYYDIPNDPADITGGYLMQFQIFNRYPGDTASGFVTSRGQAVDIKSPKYASKAQVTYLRDLMQDLEDAIYSDDGYNSKGKHYSDYIDMDSLLLCYLVEEITNDADGTFASFCFYKDSDTNGDGKIHCAPVWDFDLSLGNFSRRIENSKGVISSTFSTDQLYIACFPINGWDNEIGDGKGSENPNTAGVSWIGMLYEREETVQRAAELYYTRFDKYLKTLTESSDNSEARITAWSKELSASAAMNNAKTHMYGGREYRGLGPEHDGENSAETAEYVRDFLARRREGLRKIWAEPFTEAKKQALQMRFDALDLNRYDAEGQQALKDIMETAYAAFSTADGADTAAAIYDSAVLALSELPMALMYGDFNCDGLVDVKDAQAALVYYGETIVGRTVPLNATQRRNGDVDGNGIIDALDAMCILQYSGNAMSGIPYRFPIEDN